jgi:monothiol glutaredoxin
MTIFEKLDTFVKNYPVLSFIKGTPLQPLCGFTAKILSVLKRHQLDFAYIDVITTPEVRQHLPSWSQWPTFPQIFINHEFIGGCDIFLDIDSDGTLANLIAEKKLPCHHHIINVMEN